MGQSAFRTFACVVTTTRIAVTLMHRDTKLGLALAILVMGFAAALCFPRESGEDRSDLSLQTAADLDAAIRLMPAKAYTDADRRESRPAEKSSVDVVQSEPQPAQEVLPLAGVPDPNFVSHDPEPTPVDPSALPPEVIVAEPVIHTRTYLVQPNDTLSGIAGEELGSTKRWSELLDANPMLGGNPLALRHGMQLVIPIPSGDEVLPPPAASVPVPSAVTLPGSASGTTHPSPAPTRSTKHFSAVPRIGSGTTSPSPR